MSHINERVDSFNRLKDELHAELCFINDSLDRMKMRIRDNVKNEQNPDGLLTHMEQDYNDCLELRKFQFAFLLEED